MSRGTFLNEINFPSRDIPQLFNEISSETNAIDEQFYSSTLTAEPHKYNKLSDT